MTSNASRRAHAAAARVPAAPRRRPRRRRATCGGARGGRVRRRRVVPPAAPAVPRGDLPVRRAAEAGQPGLLPQLEPHLDPRPVGGHRPHQPDRRPAHPPDRGVDADRRCSSPWPRWPSAWGRCSACSPGWRPSAGCSSPSASSWPSRSTPTPSTRAPTSCSCSPGRRWCWPAPAGAPAVDTWLATRADPSTAPAAGADGALSRGAFIGIVAAGTAVLVGAVAGIGRIFAPAPSGDGGRPGRRVGDHHDVHRRHHDHRRGGRSDHHDHRAGTPGDGHRVGVAGARRGIGRVHRPEVRRPVPGHPAHGRQLRGLRRHLPPRRVHGGLPVGRRTSSPARATAPSSTRGPVRSSTDRPRPV